MSFWKSKKITEQSERIIELEEQVQSLQKKLDATDPNNGILITKEYIQELAENSPDYMKWDIWSNNATLHFYHEGYRLKETFIHLNFSPEDNHPSMTAWCTYFLDKNYNLHLDGRLAFTKDNLNLFINIFTELMESEYGVL